MQITLLVRYWQWFVFAYRCHAASHWLKQLTNKSFSMQISFVLFELLTQLFRSSHNYLFFFSFGRNGILKGIAIIIVIIIVISVLVVSFDAHNADRVNHILPTFGEIIIKKNDCFELEFKSSWSMRCRYFSILIKIHEIKCIAVRYTSKQSNKIYQLLLLF